MTIKSLKVQFKAEQVCASLYKFVQLCAVLCKSPAFSTKSTIPSYISTRSLYISYEASLCTTVQVCASRCKCPTLSTKLLIMFQAPIVPINIVSKASYGIFKCHASLAQALKTESLFSLVFLSLYKM